MQSHEKSELKYTSIEKEGHWESYRHKETSYQTNNHRSSMEHHIKSHKPKSIYKLNKNLNIIYIL